MDSHGKAVWAEMKDIIKYEYNIFNIFKGLFLILILPLMLVVSSFTQTNALKPLAFSYGDTRRNAFRRANME